MPLPMPLLERKSALRGGCKPFGNGRNGRGSRIDIRFGAWPIDRLSGTLQRDFLSNRGHGRLACGCRFTPEGQRELLVPRRQGFRSPSHSVISPFRLSDSSASFHSLRSLKNPQTFETISSTSPSVRGVGESGCQSLLVSIASWSFMPCMYPLRIGDILSAGASASSDAPPK